MWCSRIQGQDTSTVLPYFQSLTVIKIGIVLALTALQDLPVNTRIFLVRGKIPIWYFFSNRNGWEKNYQKFPHTFSYGKITIFFFNSGEKLPKSNFTSHRFFLLEISLKVPLMHRNQFLPLKQVFQALFH